MERRNDIVKEAERIIGIAKNQTQSEDNARRSYLSEPGLFRGDGEVVVGISTVTFTPQEQRDRTFAERLKKEAWRLNDISSAEKIASSTWDNHDKTLSEQRSRHTVINDQLKVGEWRTHISSEGSSDTKGDNQGVVDAKTYVRPWWDQAMLPEASYVLFSPDASRSSFKLFEMEACLLEKVQKLSSGAVADRVYVDDRRANDKYKGKFQFELSAQLNWIESDIRQKDNPSLTAIQAAYLQDEISKNSLSNARAGRLAYEVVKLGDERIGEDTNEPLSVLRISGSVILPTRATLESQTFLENHEAAVAFGETKYILTRNGFEKEVTYPKPSASITSESKQVNNLTYSVLEITSKEGFVWVKEKAPLTPADAVLIAKCFTVLQSFSEEKPNDAPGILSDSH